MRMNSLTVLSIALASFAAQQPSVIHGKDGITLPPPPSVKIEPVVD
jgi:hypothetical protein